MKIYTKTGDKGQTSLYGGTKVPKNHIRIEAYGTIDELNSFLGLLRNQIPLQDITQKINTIQNCLFNLGAELATPSDKMILENGKYRLQNLIEESHVQNLENWIDEMELKLQPLQNFILPAGSAEIATTHICRTVCRRCERIVVALNEFDEIREICIRYLNRLSDFLFVMARYIAVLEGKTEIIWNNYE